MASERKRAEELKLAEEDYAKAVKYTKKTLTRWKPDWDQASRFYREAVKHFKIAGDDDRTIAVARESAVAHEEVGQFLQCAVDLELAATLLLKSSNKIEKDQAYELFKESAINYRKNNNSEKAAGLLVKAAESVESTSEGQLQSINQSVNQTVNQSINRSISQSIIQSIS
jgi:tetratricopeptide (TPR) repeat protein